MEKKGNSSKGRGGKEKMKWKKRKRKEMRGGKKKTGEKRQLFETGIKTRGRIFFFFLKKNLFASYDFKKEFTDFVHVKKTSVLRKTRMLPLSPRLLTVIELTK